MAFHSLPKIVVYADESMIKFRHPVCATKRDCIPVEKPDPYSVRVSHMGSPLSFDLQQVREKVPCHVMRKKEVFEGLIVDEKEDHIVTLKAASGKYITLKSDVISKPQNYDDYHIYNIGGDGEDRELVALGMSHSHSLTLDERSNTLTASERTRVVAVDVEKQVCHLKVKYMTPAIRWNSVVDVVIHPGSRERMCLMPNSEPSSLAPKMEASSMMASVTLSAFLSSDMRSPIQARVHLVKEEKAEPERHAPSPYAMMARAPSGGEAEEEAESLVYKLGPVMVTSMKKITLASEKVKARLFDLIRGHRAGENAAEVAALFQAPYYLTSSNMNVVIRKTGMHTSFHSRPYQRGEHMILPVAKSPNVRYNAELSDEVVSEDAEHNQIRRKRGHILIKGNSSMPTLIKARKEGTILSVNPEPDAQLHSGSKFYWIVVRESDEPRYFDFEYTYRA